jgi:thiamine biosynthesis lipoprotein
MFRYLSLILLILAILVIVVGCGDGQSYPKTGFYLYNLFEIKAYSGRLSAEKTDKVLNNALESIRDLDRRTNELDPISDINALNDNAAVRPVKVQPEVYALVEKALTGAELTEGAYDPTNEPLWRLFKNDRVPAASAAAAALRKLNYKEVQVDQTFQTIRYNTPGLRLTFDPIKKGFAIDIIAKALQKEGIAKAVIRAGNTVYVMGRKSFPVDITNPDDAGKKIATFYLKNQAFSAVSGQKDSFYRNAGLWVFGYREKIGVSDNALPVYSGVFAPNAVTAEVLANALFVLGPEKGLAVLRSLHYDGFCIERDENGKLQVFSTNGLKKKIKGLNS